MSIYPFITIIVKHTHLRACLVMISGMILLLVCFLIESRIIIVYLTT